MLVGIIAFVPNFVAAQEATATSTPTATVIDTPTTSPSSMPTFTPTIAPTETPVPTAVPVETQTSAPTSYSVEDIHSEFEQDFENINVQLTAIYEQVDSSHGESIVEGLAVEFLADAIKPSEQTSSVINFWAKLIGSLSLFFKVTIVVVRFVKNDKTKWEPFNTILGVFLFVYALLFVLLLFKPNVLQQQPLTETPRDIALSNIEVQLSTISTYLENHTISPLAEIPTDTGNAQMTNVEVQLANVAKELNEIKLQDQQAVEEINNRFDELNTSVQDTKSVAAKRGWLGFNTILLLAILGFLLYSRFESSGRL